MSRHADGLGAAFLRQMADMDAGIRRCDRTGCVDPKSVRTIATTTRWDELRGYDHHFCATHADEWDATPVDAR